MRRGLFAFLLGLAGFALAQAALEVIPLRHRTVEQVLPVLRPLLEPGGALTGQANQLIVRTSPANLAEIRRVLDAIDTPLRRLVISVRFDTNADASARSLEARGTLRSADVAIGTAAPPPDRSRVEVRIADSRSARDERVDQHIQVLEGARAYISTGETRPVREQSVLRTPAGVVIAESTGFQEASTGFEVVPRLSGNTVLLEVAPRQQAFARGGAIQGQAAASAISAKLGEWVELGGTAETEARDERGILASREARAQRARRIWLKVEEARP